ncbi:uncharacterized protein MONOS_17642 [Monocercomonoides exilis]|uniref:uncharacterized protein n=1 Tax=Monocercomonoides exilis TaxID=2049356 RepID=UPI00355A6D95|nr:hypothetical protein MONOS_17642 [Monocercomonoides exilis]
MLLHGRNEKKEMAIGSLQQREQTAAQILFWVANGALHSFEEMENPLQSLSNLSPHIVLFSEHMVICIVIHSDLLSNDSDSSSISSSTAVTSASDDDDEDSLPSSAFEDEDDFRKECLRWKAPELLINKKMGAAKESVSFSIGMMLWECLTLQIPFGEYEAEVAGQKIANGERPALEAVQCSSFFGLVKSCVSQSPGARPSLVQLKREFIGRFPPGAAVLTLTDAVDLEDSTDGHRQGTTSLAFSASSTANEAQPTFANLFEQSTYFAPLGLIFAEQAILNDRVALPCASASLLRLATAKGFPQSPPATNNRLSEPGLANSHNITLGLLGQRMAQKPNTKGLQPHHSEDTIIIEIPFPYSLADAPPMPLASILSPALRWIAPILAKPKPSEYAVFCGVLLCLLQLPCFPKAAQRPFHLFSLLDKSNLFQPLIRVECAHGPHDSFPLPRCFLFKNHHI